MTRIEARYDTIGRTYADSRREDPRLAAAIRAALGDARTVVNVGAGTGSYEPDDARLLAVEPSAAMIAQRPPGAHPAVLATAEALPLADGSFDAATAILSIHHWTDPRRGIEEMRRVARRSVVLTFDRAVLRESWVRHYAPQINELDEPFPSIGELAGWMGAAAVSPLPIPADCSDLFLEAWFGRPELMLDAAIRANTSGFALLGAQAERNAVERLRTDLASGEWDRRWGRLRAVPEHDGGLRLLVAERG
ncbi:class I SAM-dependent methyltransferase [Thermoleophilia bacterium SCSIO 60948]|nr:class I SAM-dependent methyltransferase [Thermoleophilia bacterium SCSIO 60948]